MFANRRSSIWTGRISLIAVWLITGVLSGQDLTVAEIAGTAQTRYGAHLDADGWVHFVVFSPAACQVSLLLY